MQEGCKICCTYGIFGYTRRDKLFIFVGVGVFHPLLRRFFSGEPGSFERVETPLRLKRLLRKKGWHRNYAKANNGCRDAPSFDERAVVPLPALFTRSCCFHHELSTTSSATPCHEVVAMIDSLSPEKAALYHCFKSQKRAGKSRISKRPGTHRGHNMSQAEFV